MEQTRYRGVLSVDEFKPFVFDRIIDCNRLFEMAEPGGELPGGTAAHAQGMMCFDQETGIAAAARQLEALLSHLESGGVFGSRGVVDPKTPKGAEQLRSFLHLLTQFARAGEYTAH